MRLGQHRWLLTKNQTISTTFFKLGDNQTFATQILLQKLRKICYCSKQVVVVTVVLLGVAVAMRVRLISQTAELFFGHFAQWFLF